MGDEQSFLHRIVIVYDCAWIAAAGISNNEMILNLINKRDYVLS